MKGGLVLLKFIDQTLTWKDVNGVIISSEVKRDLKSEETIYYPDIVYSYKIGNTIFTNGILSYSQLVGSDIKHEENIIKKYPKGEFVKVFYDPVNPKISCLEIGRKRESYFTLIGGFIFFFTGLMFWIIGILAFYDK